MSGKLRENMQMSEKLYINEKNRQKNINLDHIYWSYNSQETQNI